jgi:hypothetical protein
MTKAARYSVQNNPKRRIVELNNLLHLILNATAGVPATQVMKALPKRKDLSLSVSTLRNLRNGTTIYPSIKTAFIIAMASGRMKEFNETLTTGKLPENLPAPLAIKTKKIGNYVKLKPKKDSAKLTVIHGGKVVA